MKRVWPILVVLSLYACKAPETPKKAQVDRFNEIMLAVDSVSPFNGILGVLRKGEKPLIIYHGNKSPLEASPPLDSLDYFHIASNSKLFAGYAALEMMERQGLSWNDSIGPYFPELHPNLGVVTIQQLANHTCAIHDYLSLVPEPQGITNAQALQLLTQLDSTVYEPGLRWGYTNSGYVLLSLLAERVTQQPYNEFLISEILTPLGMSEVQLHPNSISSLKGHDHGKPAHIVSVTTGGSGMYVRVKELISFFENQEKVSKYTQQAQAGSSPWHDESWRYGFGWFFSKDSLGKFRAHSGKSGGFEAYFRIYDSNDLMFFILSNHVNGSAKVLREKVIEELNKR